MGAFGESAVRIFVSAGEASGDLHGSHLVRAIREYAPNAVVTCLGGPMLRQAGASVLVDNKEIAVVGLFEVFRHGAAIREAWHKIKAHLVHDRPDIVVLIDFPDFNFILARLAKRLGIRIFYYISPQVWAWRSGRVRTLKRLVDRMAVILPFETEFYKKRGMEVEFVGHPLLDILDKAPAYDEAGKDYRLKDTAFLVGLLPGSRYSEIRSLLPVLMDTAAILAAKIPGISFILPVAPSLDHEMIEREVYPEGLPIRVVRGDTYGVIRSCDLVLTASGTVTLETAILGSPMIIFYKFSELSYYMGRHLIKVKYAGLPNLIAGRGIVPELIQHDATVERIAAEAASLLLDPQRLTAQRGELAAIRGRLGEPGVARRVAKMVLDDCKSGALKSSDSDLADRDVLSQRSSNNTPVLSPRWRPGSRKAHRSRIPAFVGMTGEESCRDLFAPHSAKPPPFRWNSIYGAVSALAWPFLLLYYFLRSRTDGKYRSNYLERMGLKLPAPLPVADRVWIHALSVGETISVVPLVKALKELAPELEIVFSTTSETGQRIARERLGIWVSSFFYLPHDFPWAIDRIVGHIKPRFFVLVETDIWPGLLKVLKSRNVPAALVNGRISEKSYKKLIRLSRFFGTPFPWFEHIFAQSAEDSAKYIALGASEDRVHAAGNLKFDSLPAALSDSDIASLRDSTGIDPGRPVWIAGSTHEGEEETLLDIHQELRSRYPDLLLILAPRNVQRAQSVAALCDRYAMPVAFRSKEQSAEGKAVYLLDTLGELGFFYALADAAFIGGSLVPFGGHNPLEAVAQGKPALWGPHLFNFREIEVGLIETGHGKRVPSREELGDLLDLYLKQANRRQDFPKGTQQHLATSHSGCSRRIAQALLDSLR
ncbi:MAG: lipid-A-disaccharide synthase [Syntrophobacteraceae bacterium]